MKAALKCLMVVVMLSINSAPAVALSSFSSSSRSSFSSSRSGSSSRSTTSRTTTRSTSAKSTASKPATAPSTKTSLFGGKAKVSSSYRPTFRGGYTPPVGSTVIYQSDPWYSYLPLMYLLSHDSHKDVAVQQPDGKTVKTQDPGIDRMYVFNWIMTILIALGLIGLLVWWVNKLSKRNHYASV
jgi:cobalamin biosynthesis Mg chelatase CobN